MSENSCVKRLCQWPFFVRLGLPVALGILAVLALVGLVSAGPRTIAQTGAPVPGSLDADFGSGGIVVTSISSGHDDAYAVAIQNDGGIVVAGCARVGSSDYFALARYTTSGTLDPAFGVGGIITTPVVPYETCANDVAIQSDKIIVAGYANSLGPRGGFTDFAVVRYLASGALDTSFGHGGIVTTSVGTAYDGAQGIALQPDGKIVAVGSTEDDGSSHGNTAIVRYTVSGTLDTAFGTGGIVTTAVSAYDNWARDVAVQNDGRIVAVGFAIHDETSYDFLVLRYSTSGALDHTFGTGGIVTTPVSSGFNHDFASGVVIQDDGKIVVAGDAGGCFALARYTISGTLDTTFGHGGIATTCVSSGHNCILGVAIQDDGKIVGAGQAYDAFSLYDFATVRYTVSGTLDTTFGGTGVVIISISASRDFAEGVAIQRDGKIVAAGSMFNGSNYDFALVRYHGRYAVYYLPLVLRSK